MKLKSFIWIFLGMLALVLNGLFAAYPALYNAIYFKGIFQVLRVIYDYTLGWIPIPMVYFLFIALVVLIYNFFRFKGLRNGKSKLKILGIVSFRVLSFAGAIIFFFYFLWGFNYQQKALSEKLDFPEVKADSTELFEESMFMLDKLKELRAEISTDTMPLSFEHIPEGLENEIRVNLKNLFQTWDWPVNGRVRVRTLYPKGTLLRISTAGVYIPFVLEGHIDAGLHPIQYPFIMAHEMSHGYGITDEGTCNFTGFLICMGSDDPMIQYSACMGIWRYMAGNLRRASLSENIKSSVKTASQASLSGPKSWVISSAS